MTLAAWSLRFAGTIRDPTPTSSRMTTTPRRGSTPPLRPTSSRRKSERPCPGPCSPSLTRTRRRSCPCTTPRRSTTGAACLSAWKGTSEVSAGIPARNRPSVRSLFSHARVDRYWLTCSLLAAVMLATTAVLPLWHMHFFAPQYPKGLHLTAYGTSLEGDLVELNALNHYIGVTPIDDSN